MAPNKRGGAPSKPAQPQTSTAVETNGSVIAKEEVEARGSGTEERGDTYNSKKRVRSEMRVFFTGLMFLTRLPCPGWCDHHPAFLMRSMQWFPLIGALVGCWGAVFFNAAVLLWTPTIAAAVSTLATVWLTGCFHEDGLSDCFDGFGGGWGRVQILRIMKDSRIGTYALVGMLLVLHQKLHAIASLPPADVAAIMVSAHCACRWTSIPLLYFCTYLQDDEDAKKGLYNWFAQSQSLLTPIRLVIGTATALAVPLALLGVQKAMLVYGVIVLTTMASAYYGKAVLGGVVGDYLGATIQVAEVFVYLALAADWTKLQSFEAARPIVILTVVTALPLIYSRRIVDFGSSC